MPGFQPELLRLQPGVLPHPLIIRIKQKKQNQLIFGGEEDDGRHFRDREQFLIRKRKVHRQESTSQTAKISTKKRNFLNWTFFN